MTTLVSLLQNLEQPGGAHAAADAHGYDRKLGLAAPALDQGVTGETRAGHAIGMADRDRAAIDVDLFRIDSQFVAPIDHLHREGLVQFPQIYVVDLETVAFEQARHREHRTDAHLIRLAAGRNKAAEDAERLEATPGRFLVAHDHGRAGAIRQLAGVAGCDGEAFAAHRLEARKTLGRRIRP